MDTESQLETLRQGLAEQDYICNQSIATTVYLANQLNKPVLVEGPPGVGKTELAKCCAGVYGLPLIRLQCYEGLDETKALYEWKYGKQLLYTQMMKSSVEEMLEGAEGLAQGLEKLQAQGDIFFSHSFLEPRPLLQALKSDQGCVLLIDEIDKADQAFEALLLEILSEYQVSIPEIGTIVAERKPMVFLTSNSEREMSDALKRRCLHLHIPFPDAAMESQIVRLRAPGVEEGLLKQLVAFIQQLRTLDLKKPPAVSETIDWAKSLLLLNIRALDQQLVRDTLHIVLKYQQDIELVASEMHAITREAWNPSAFRWSAKG